MPISLEEFEKLEKEKVTRGRVNWDEVLEKMKVSRQAFTAQDILELINNEVGITRVNGWLRSQVQKGILLRRFDGKKFWYVHVEALSAEEEA